MFLQWPSLLPPDGSLAFERPSSTPPTPRANLTTSAFDAARPAGDCTLVGALGPLQALGAAGSMTISLTPAGTGTNIALRYRVGGWASDGMKKWAAPVDGVLGEQLGRLKRLIDSGDPETPGAK